MIIWSSMWAHSLLLRPHWFLSKLGLFQTPEWKYLTRQPTEMKTWDLMKWKLIQDRKLSWSDVLKVMATRNYILKLCIKQSLPFPPQAICRWADLQSSMPGPRRKCTNSNVHVQSEAARTQPAVHIKHRTHKQKHLHPVFMARVCFTSAGQLPHSFLLQTGRTTALSQHHCSTIWDARCPLLPRTHLGLD